MIACVTAHSKKGDLLIQMRARTVFSTLIPAFVACTLALRGQSKMSGSDAVAAITDLENEQVKADKSNAREFIEKNVANNFVGGTSFGYWETKASMLKDAGNPGNKVNSMSISDLKVNAYGNAGIARYTLAYDDMYNGQHRSRSVLCTDTWVKQAAAWQEVASHCSEKK